MRKEKHLDVCEAWDKDEKTNESEYLSEDMRYVALRKWYTGTEFVKWFVSTEGKRFNFLIKMWAYLNK